MFTVQTLCSVFAYVYRLWDIDAERYFTHKALDICLTHVDVYGRARQVRRPCQHDATRVTGSAALALEREATVPHSHFSCAQKMSQ